MCLILAPHVVKRRLDVPIRIGLVGLAADSDQFLGNRGDQFGWLFMFVVYAPSFASRFQRVVLRFSAVWTVTERD